MCVFVWVCVCLMCYRCTYINIWYIRVSSRPRNLWNKTSEICLIVIFVLNTLLIEKGSHKRYAMPTVQVVWALCSFKIWIWSELHWWALKERNFLARAGRIWKWTLQKVPCLETLKNFLKSDKKWSFVNCWDNFWAAKDRIVIELVGYHLLLWINFRICRPL